MQTQQRHRLEPWIFSHLLDCPRRLTLGLEPPSCEILDHLSEIWTAAIRFSTETANQRIPYVLGAINANGTEISTRSSGKIIRSILDTHGESLMSGALSVSRSREGPEFHLPIAYLGKKTGFLKLVIHNLYNTFSPFGINGFNIESLVTAALVQIWYEIPVSTITELIFQPRTGIQKLEKPYNNLIHKTILPIIDQLETKWKHNERWAKQTNFMSCPICVFKQSGDLPCVM